MTHDLQSMHVLLPYQQAWISDKAIVQVIEKSRRIGISWADAARSALEAASQEDSRNAVYMGNNHDMARTYIKDVAMWAANYDLAASAWEAFDYLDQKTEADGKVTTKTIAAFRITFATGREVISLASRPDNFRSKQGRVIIDEAAFHSDIEKLLEAALALTIWGDSISIISTHNGENNAFNTLIKRIRAGEYPDYSLHRVTFNQAVDEGLIPRILLKMGKAITPENIAAHIALIRRIYKGRDGQELDVIPSKSEGAYLSYALIESCMVDGLPVLRLTCPPDFAERPKHEREAFFELWLQTNVAPILARLPKYARHYYGWDFARNGDLSVMTNLTETQALHHVASLTIELRNVPFQQQSQTLFFVVDRLPRFSKGANDARGNGQYLAEVAMQRYGAALIDEIMPTQAFYRENWPKFKDAMEQGQYHTPRDADHMADYQSVTVENGVPKVPDDGHTTGTDGQKRHGDAAMSGMLANYASRNPGALIEFESINESEIGSQYNDFIGTR
jgi:phage FluMu gp28-like protein